MLHEDLGIVYLTYSLLPNTIWDIDEEVINIHVIVEAMGMAKIVQVQSVEWE